jgi:hypothetical protein
VEEDCTWQAAYPALDAMNVPQEENGTALASAQYSDQQPLAPLGSLGLGESNATQFSAMAEQLSGPCRTHGAAVSRGIRLQLGMNGSAVLARAPEPPEYRLLEDQLWAYSDASEIETCPPHFYASWSQVHTGGMHGSRDIQPNATNSWMGVDDPSPVSLSSAARIPPAAAVRCSCVRLGGYTGSIAVSTATPWLLPQPPCAALISPRCAC